MDKSYKKYICEKGEVRTTPFQSAINHTAMKATQAATPWTMHRKYIQSISPKAREANTTGAKIRKNPVLRTFLI